MNNDDFVKELKKAAAEHEAILNRLIESTGFFDCLKSAIDLIVAAYRSGNKLLLCGNGGSAADAQHIAAELVGRFYLERKALDAEALSVNTSSLTAIGNDYSFEQIFCRQVEAKGRSGDILIGITTSGTSGNVLAAFGTARRYGLKNICLTGENAPSSLNDICDVVIRVPSPSTPRIQEMHIFLGHIMCEYIEKALIEFNQ